MFKFGYFELDQGAYALRRDGHAVSIERIPLDLLFLLVERRGQLVTRTEILERVWGEGVFVDGANAVNTAVRKLRRALSDDPSKPQFIATVPTKGYRFIAAVEPDRGRGSVVESPAASDRSIAEMPDRLIVGREQELARLHSYFERANHGTRQIVFVTGEPGIGKTTVIGSFCASLGRGSKARIGRGQCIEQYGSSEPYMPVLEAISRLCNEAGGNQVVEMLNRLAPSWLAQMPALLSEAERDRLERVSQGVTQPRMLREMAEALETLTHEIPLVLAFEDLHWSDVSTVELIAAIGRRNEPARLLVIGAYRPVEMLTNDHRLRAVKRFDLDALAVAKRGGLHGLIIFAIYSPTAVWLVELYFSAPTRQRARYCSFLVLLFLLRNRNPARAGGNFDRDGAVLQMIVGTQSLDAHGASRVRASIVVRGPAPLGRCP
jgi:DNA-binding winged helix-turn-helix (wHTH) protein